MSLWNSIVSPLINVSEREKYFSGFELEGDMARSRVRFNFLEVK